MRHICTNWRQSQHKDTSWMAAAACTAPLKRPGFPCIPSYRSNDASGRARLTAAEHHRSRTGTDMCGGNSPCLLSSVRPRGSQPDAA